MSSNCSLFPFSNKPTVHDCPSIRRDLRTPCSYDSSQEIILRRHRLTLIRVMWTKKKPKNVCMERKEALENGEMKQHAVHFKQKHRGVFRWKLSLCLIDHASRPYKGQTYGTQLLPNWIGIVSQPRTPVCYESITEIAIVKRQQNFNCIFSWTQWILTKASRYTM